MNTSNQTSVAGYQNPRACSSHRLALLACLCGAILLMPASTRASFHLWSVNEIYSNADGSVQFVEFSTSSSLEERLATHSMTCVGPLGTNTFSFPSNLPTGLGTAGRTFIVGTTNLAAQPGGLRPDYVFTNATPFLFLNAGATNTVMITGTLTTPAAYTNLPTDGLQSLARTGVGSAFATLSTNSPKSFLNISNTIVPTRIASATVAGPNLLMTFATATGTNGSAGPNYAVQGNYLAGTTDWSTVSNVTGNGTLKTVAIPIEPGTNKFFRLSVP